MNTFTLTVILLAMNILIVNDWWIFCDVFKNSKINKWQKWIRLFIVCLLIPYSYTKITKRFVLVVAWIVFWEQQQIYIVTKYKTKQNEQYKVHIPFLFRFDDRELAPHFIYVLSNYFTCFVFDCYLCRIFLTLKLSQA